MELTTLSFRVDTSELEGVITTLDKVATSIKKLNNVQKEAEVVQNKQTKAIEETANASKQLQKANEENEKSTKRSQSVLERQKDILEFMTQGYSKGQASTLAMAKASGTLSDEIKELGGVLQIQRKLIGGDPFDKSTSGLLALQNQYTELKEAVRQYNADSGVTAKQARELARDKERIIERLKVEGASFTEIKNAIRAHNQAYIEASENVNRLTQQEKEIIRVQREHANAIRAVTKEEERVASVLDSLGRQHNQNIGSARKAAEEEARYARNLKLSGISAEEATAKLATYRQQQAKIAAEEEKRNIQYLQRGLQPQIGDVAVSLASGQNPLTVMLQQGDQIRGLIAQTGVQGAALQKAMRDAMSGTVDSIKMTAGALVNVLGGAVAYTGKSIVGLVTGPFTMLFSALKSSNDASVSTADAFKIGLESTIAGLKTGAIGLAIALGTLAVALFKTQTQQDELAKSLLTSGASLGLSKEGALNLAYSMEVLGVSTNKSLDIITAFAKEGAGSLRNMHEIIPAVAQSMKYLGVSAEEMAKEYKKLSKDPVDALADLGVKTGLVSAETINLVANLVESGKRAEAVALAIKTANEVHLNVAKDMQREYSTLGKIFNETGNFFSKFWDKVKGLTYESSANEALKKQYSEINAQIEEVQKNLKANSKVGIQGDPKLLIQLQAQADSIREQLNLLDRVSTKEQNRRQEQSKAAEAMKVATSVNKQLNDDYEKLLSKQMKLNDYIDWYVKKKKEDANQKAEGAGNLLDIEKLKQAAALEWERTKAAKAGQSESRKITSAYEADLKKLNDLRIRSVEVTEHLTHAESLYRSILESDSYKKYNDVRKSALKTAMELSRQAEIDSNQEKARIKRLEEEIAAEEKLADAVAAASAEQIELSAAVWERLDAVKTEIGYLNSTEEFKRKDIALTKAKIELEKELFDISKKKIDSNSKKNLEEMAYQRFADKAKLINSEIALDIVEKLTSGLDDLAGGSFAKSAERFSKSLSEAGNVSFGRLINSLSNLNELFIDLNKQQESFAELRKQAGSDEAKLGAVVEKQKQAELKSYGDIAGAAKKFFKEGSTGYKNLQNIEKAFRAYEMAMAIKSTALKIAENAKAVVAYITGENARAAASVAGSTASAEAAMVEGQAKAVTAVATQGTGDPYTAFGRIAAMIAIMAALGFAVSGGSSGGSFSSSNQGTGTVFGDKNAKSESLGNSINLLLDVDTMTMRYSAKMLSALNSIAANIGGLTNLVLRTNGGDLTTGNSFGIKTGKSIGGLVGSLFGTKTSIQGTGLSMRDQSFGSIINQGVDLQNYVNVQKKKKFLGITYSTSNSTNYSQADSQLSDQFTKIFRSFNDAILAAAEPLGLSLNEVQSRLNNFVISVGQIDLQGLTGEQIQEKLTAVFGAASDRISEAAIPGLEKFQKVGEGYLETLVRVANITETVKVNFDQLGFSLENINPDFAMEFVGYFKDFEDMNSILGSFYQDFYSETEKTNKTIEQITKSLSELGVAMPTSRMEYRVQIEKAIAEGNQELAASLLKLSPAIAQVLPEIKGTTTGIDGISDTLKDLQSTAEDLKIQLLQAQGNTEGANTAIRELATKGMTEVEIAAWDYNNTLKNQIDAQNKANAEADRLKNSLGSLSSEYTNLSIQLMQLQGNTEGAANASRALATKGMTEVEIAAWDANEALRNQVETQRVANAEADRVKNSLATMSTEYTNLSIQLMQLQGNTEGANTAIRELATKGMTEVEIAAWDAGNALKQTISDLQSAQAAAAELAAKQKEIANEKYNLEGRLLELQGNTTALKERELQNLDPSNRALMQQIWAQEEANKQAEENARIQEQAAEEAARAAEEAARAATQLKEAWQSLTDSIFEEVARIRNLASGDSVMNLATVQRQFDIATAAAKSGDQEAAKTLPELSQKLLELANLQASSTSELRRFQMMIAASLEATGNTLAGQHGLVVPAYADGGNYQGGLALVGENGPELINFNKSGHVNTASTTASLLNNERLVSLVEKLNENIENLRYEVRANVQHSAKTASLLNRVIKDGENVSVVFDTAQPVNVI